METTFKPTPTQEAQIAELARILGTTPEQMTRTFVQKMGMLTEKTADLGLRYKTANVADSVAVGMGLVAEKAAGRQASDVTAAQVAELMADPAFAKLVEQKLAQKLKRSQQGKRGAFEDTVAGFGFEK